MMSHTMNFNGRFFMTSILFVVLLLVGCDTTSSEDDEPDNTPPPATLQPTLSSIQANIFSTTCASSRCHDSNDPEADLDLTTGNSFAELVNVASIDLTDLLLVKPSDPDSSYLIWKIEGNPGIEGDRMPRGDNAVPLTSTQTNIIRQWISDGALNN